jgi:pimeloyl-ACP methyl ester carboxylesterase
LLLASHVPNAKVTLFRNVGHMPFMEDTPAYYAALNQAIADIRHTHSTSQPASGTAA